MKLRTFAVGLCLVATSKGAVAETMVSRITDGQPWNAVADNGRKMKMTLNPDGTANLKRGIIFLKVGWVAKEDAFCLTDVPWADEDQCMTLAKTPTGFVLTGADGERITLSR